MNERHHEARGADLVVSPAQIGALPTDNSTQASEKFTQITERVIMDSESEAEAIAFSTISRTTQHINSPLHVSIQERHDVGTTDEYVQKLLDTQLQNELNQHTEHMGIPAQAQQRENRLWDFPYNGFQRSSKNDDLDMNTHPHHDHEAVAEQHVCVKAKGGSVRRGKRRKRAHQGESSSDEVVTSRREHEVKKRRTGN